MSKPTSGHFKGTSGYSFSLKNNSPVSKNRDIIIPKNIDTREHPTKYKQMSSKKLASLREKREARTITKEEYKRLER